MFDKSICVIGLGYIGLPTASLLGTKDFQVHGADVSEYAVNAIDKGKKQDLTHSLIIKYCVPRISQNFPEFPPEFPFVQVAWL